MSANDKKYNVAVFRNPLISVMKTTHNGLSTSSHTKMNTEVNDAEESLMSNHNLFEPEETHHFRGGFSYAEDDTKQLPRSFLVVKLSPNIPENTLLWLVDKIRGERAEGGAELLVMKQPYNKKEGVVLHISASMIKFLLVAEEMDMMKQDIFSDMNELENFQSKDVHIDDLLTVTERQNIVKHELENIRASPKDTSIPGYPNIELYEGQSIIHVCLKANIVKQIYPLHDKESLKKLGASWYLSLLNKQPFDEIREYFGEAVSMYFSFLGYYTFALLLPMTLGFVQLLVSAETVPFFCVVNVIWATVFLELWKRKSNELAFKWGTIGMTSLDEPRPNFYGHMGKDHVTGRLQPQYPRYKTNVKMYLVSIPIVFLCMIGAFIMMLASFWIEDLIRNVDSEWTPTLLLVPSVLYTALVYIVNVYYRKLATWLTEWENHRTQSQFDRHRVTKLVLFEFVNNFMALFYIAFYIQDMEMLRSQVATMLIILQAINHVQEAIIPLIVKLSTTKMVQYNLLGSDKSKRRDSLQNICSSYEPLHDIAEIHKDDSRIQEAEEEGMMEDYEGTYDDYLEMFIQFGYVVLFSSVYPLAAFWAVFNNVLEIRADAFKLCVVYQRPMGKRVKDIGAWQRCFEILGALAIMTNCGLLCLSPQMKTYAPDYSTEKWFMLFVFLEHLLIGIRYLIHIAIADKPEWVRMELARKAHESRKALKSERAKKSRRTNFSRRFKTVHGPHRH